MYTVCINLCLVSYYQIGMCKFKRRRRENPGIFISSITFIIIIIIIFVISNQIKINSNAQDISSDTSIKISFVYLETPKERKDKNNILAPLYIRIHVYPQVDSVLVHPEHPIIQIAKSTKKLHHEKKNISSNQLM